jgi:hypothetical protein
MQLTEKAVRVRQAFWRHEYDRAFACGDRDLQDLAQRFIDEYEEFLALTRLMATDADAKSLDRG